MKRSATVLVSLFVYLFAASESFVQSSGDHPTNGTAKYWNCQNFYEKEFAFALFCSGDTICDGKKYELLYYLNIPMTPNEIGMEEIWEWQEREREQYKQHIGELRYSDDCQRIYVRQNNKEYLLYDFSVNVGDTCSIYNGFDTIVSQKLDYGEDMIDLVVTQIYYRDGLKMIDLAEKSHLHDEKYHTTWIEGIGSQYGLFPIRIEGIPNNIPASSLLLCAWQLQSNVGLLLYHTPDEDFSFLGSTTDIISNTCASIIIADMPTDVHEDNDNSVCKDDERLPYNIWGQPVRKQHKGIVIMDGQKFINL